MLHMSITEQTAGGVPRWTITDRLRKAREDRGLSQRALAEASHGELKLRTISNYESPSYDGERKRSTLRSWAFATGVPLEWLTDGIEPSDGPGGKENASTKWKAPVLSLATVQRRAAA